MGFVCGAIADDGPLFNAMMQRIDNGWVWVVVRRETEPRPGGGPHDWHLQGIGSDEAAAVAMCVDETYCIGPLPIDSPLPHERMEWPGSYFPLKPH